MLVTVLTGCPHRNSSSHSGSSFLAEMARTTSSLRPLGKTSLSIMVLKPYLYGLLSIFWMSRFSSDISSCSATSAAAARTRTSIALLACRRGGTHAAPLGPAVGHGCGATRLRPYRLQGARCNTTMDVSECTIACLRIRILQIKFARRHGTHEFGLIQHLN